MLTTYMTAHQTTGELVVILTCLMAVRFMLKGPVVLPMKGETLAAKVAEVNTQTFFMGVFKSYGGDQFLSVNNKEKLTPVRN